MAVEVLIRRLLVLVLRFRPGVPLAEGVSVADVFDLFVNSLQTDPGQQVQAAHGRSARLAAEPHSSTWPIS